MTAGTLSFGSPLLDYLQRRTKGRFVVQSDWALQNASAFGLAGVEVEGAVLFADLPNFTELATKWTAAECAYYVSHFFAWFHGTAGRFGGIIDKYIGDGVMVVFLPDICDRPPLEAALRAASAVIVNDHLAFEPHIGIASGHFAIALTGTVQQSTATAIGTTVNVAARCAGTTERPGSVRIATQDIALVSQCFTGQPQEWRLSECRHVDLKGVGATSVIDVSRNARWYRNFDYHKDVRQIVRAAYKTGAIVPL